jgi:hypothetical protein
MKRILLSALAIAIVNCGLAQQRQAITAGFTNAKFKEVAASIEQQTDFKVYFRKGDVDSLSVTTSASAEQVGKFLDRIFAGTTLQYNIYQSGIYVTNGKQILTTLPPGFYQQQIPTEKRPAFDYSDYERREREQELAEEKLYVIGPKTTDLQGEITLTGTITDSKTGEALVGASVFIQNPTIGVATDPFGRYILRLPKGRHELHIKSIGMKNARRRLMLYGNGKLDIELEEDIIPLKEVLIESERDVRVTGMQMGAEKLDIKVMKQLPTSLGETDIMKVVMTLPGVQTVGEGTVGLNVRGGATSQNLILFNDAIVYNPSHMFGFFSTFNPDVMKSVELYKSGITADYGGRLSSVLDVHSREGNLKKFSGSGGISPITGRLTLEGPIIKEKASFLVGVRSTYSDWILKRLNSARLRNSEASFYDLTANLNYKINENNTIVANGYMSKDQFKLNSDTTYQYSDRNGSIKWKHIFNRQLYSTFTGGYSNYNYNITSDQNPIEGFLMDFSIRQLSTKADFTYFLNPRHTITTGISTIHYKLSPGNFGPYGEESLVKSDNLQQEQAMESAVYIGDNIDLNPRTSIYVGLRYSLYQNLGPKEVYQYVQGEPLQIGTMSDTIQYGAGKSVAKYGGPEPRISLRHILSKSASIKFSYNRLRQYIQMLSNTTAITPTDIWKLSDAYVKPQIGDQVSLGVYKNLKGNLIETSAEVYYKTMKDVADYKNGAELLLNHHLETDILNARGKAYGAEVMIKKTLGKVNGWISYTWSRSFLQTKDAYESELVNRGEWYRSNFDKPHAINFIGNYKFSRRVNVSFNAVYSTGRPITLPVAKYEIGGVARVFYSDRNQYRIPDYFRTDLSINLEGNHKIRKLAHSSWTFAVYNLTGRRNAYSVFFVSQDSVIKGYKLSIFAQPIPTITYNFKF